ncbi:MAG: hypothetical protein IPI54_08755 [Chitinophagaceae bacterium]|nr:hypothetical protein [Chitinophagaceae bacterium]
MFSDKNPNGWDVQHIGTDQAGNAYLANPLNNHILVNKFDMADKSKVEAAATILHSANRKNYVHPANDDDIWNVMAISPSGKQFAYINLYHRSDVGNYAPLCCIIWMKRTGCIPSTIKQNMNPTLLKTTLQTRRVKTLRLAGKTRERLIRTKGRHCTKLK